MTGVGFGLSTSISILAKNSSAESKISIKVHSFSSETRELFNSKCLMWSNAMSSEVTRNSKQDDLLKNSNRDRNAWRGKEKRKKTSNW